jgi:hypothetical protein
MQKLPSVWKFHVEPRFGSLDHLVGERKQPIRHVDAKRLGSPEIDHQLELGRQYDWQITRLLAFENASSIDPA